MALKFDIQNENFDYFFLEQAAKMGEAEKVKLPKELLYKVYRKGYRLNYKGVYKISFLEKLFVLVTVLNKKWFLLVEDELNGMNAEDLFKYKELMKKRDYGEGNAEDLLSQGMFALAAPEVLDVFQKLNYLSTGPAYNYLMRVKTNKHLQPDEHKRDMNYLCRFINNYEAQKKRFTLDTGINIQEWIVLTYLYDGDEKKCSILYKEKFKASFNSSATKIKLALGTLQFKGFIIKHGARATSKFQITALGKQMVSDIMKKYILNC